MYRTYTDPNYFIERIRTNPTYTDAIFKKGPQWAEMMFPGNEAVKQAAQEVYDKIKAYRESDEYKQKQAARNYYPVSDRWAGEDFGWH